MTLVLPHLVTVNVSLLLLAAPLSVLVFLATQVLPHLVAVNACHFGQPGEPKPVVANVW